MMTMNTQYGKMTITDDNLTVADEKLKEHINDAIQDGKKPQFANPEIIEMMKRD